MPVGSTGCVVEGYAFKILNKLKTLEVDHTYYCGVLIVQSAVISGVKLNKT